MIEHNEDKKILALILDRGLFLVEKINYDLSKMAIIYFLGALEQSVYSVRKP